MGVYVLDDAIPGSFAKAGGYIRVLPPRPRALAALREAQNVDSTGRLVEPTRFTAIPIIHFVAKTWANQSS